MHRSNKSRYYLYTEIPIYRGVSRRYQTGTNPQFASGGCSVIAITNMRSLKVGVPSFSFDLLFDYLLTY